MRLPCKKTEKLSTSPATAPFKQRKSAVAKLRNPDAPHRGGSAVAKLRNPDAPHRGVRGPGPCLVSNYGEFAIIKIGIIDLHPWTDKH